MAKVLSVSSTGCAFVHCFLLSVLFIGLLPSGTYRGIAVAIKEIDRTSWENHERDMNSGTDMGSMTMDLLASTKLLAEAAILSKLRHPNLVFFYGCAVADGEGQDAASVEQAKVSRYYFVTELCTNCLREVRLGWSEAEAEGEQLWEVLAQVARGMQYLHSKRILHRDLKPGNVLVVEMPSGDSTCGGTSEGSTDAPVRMRKIYKLW